jgi:Histidine kinase-, DNA gyrase B-, and HSP90-like ATPase
MAAPNAERTAHRVGDGDPQSLEMRSGSQVLDTAKLHDKVNHAAVLARHIFKTSRLAEFCSRKELVNQTGHGFEDWPLVVLKELIDNALDAAEESGIAPVINIAVTQTGIEITDNGPGMAPEKIDAILDYTVRVSSREAYVSPTRGAQGNALKTILAMPFALDGERGDTLIESQGVAHRISFSIDRIRQEPKVTRVFETSSVKNGTRITVHWPDSASSILDDAKPRFLQIAKNYTWVNLHLTLAVNWNRVEDLANSTKTRPRPDGGLRRPILAGASGGRRTDFALLV